MRPSCCNNMTTALRTSSYVITGSQSSDLWAAPNANPPRLYDDEAAEQLLTFFVDQTRDRSGECRTGIAGEANQNHSACRSGVGVNQFAKVLVLSQEHPVLPYCQVDDGRILGARGNLENSRHIVSSRPERTDYGKIT